MIVELKNRDKRLGTPEVGVPPRLHDGNGQHHQWPAPYSGASGVWVSFGAVTITCYMHMVNVTINPLACMTGTGSALCRMMVSSHCASCRASGRFP